MAQAAEDIRYEISRAMDDDERLFAALRMQMERVREFVLREPLCPTGSFSNA